LCIVTKPAGTGSEPHYHPNALLIFPTAGKLNAVAGQDRRIVGPGTFVHAPAFARHSMRAAEDAELGYLYLKDKTWTVVGLAVDERVPEKALSIEEINALHAGDEQRTLGAGAVVHARRSERFALAPAPGGARCQSVHNRPPPQAYNGTVSTRA
jgi:hypothetical protein